MATFRFRAAVALDLRVAAEKDALTARSRAEARFHEAERALAAEQARRETAQVNLVHVERAGSDVDTLLWHRNWIVRLATLVDERRRDLDDRARDLGVADSAWREARRQRLALERMRDRALERFQREEHRREMKSLDELARIRHVMAESGAQHEH